MVDCLKCINSACCKLKVDLNRSEYNQLFKLGLKDKMETYTDIFLKQNAKYERHRSQLDEMHKDNFAKIKKNDKGNCVLLDKNMMCTIYENRPKVCRDYKQSRCINIRELKE